MYFENSWLSEIMFINGKIYHVLFLYLNSSFASYVTEIFQTYQASDLEFSGAHFKIYRSRFYALTCLRDQVIKLIIHVIVVSSISTYTL